MDTTPEAIRTTLESRFSEIENTRMGGVPLLNKNLSVAALGFEPWQEYALGVLVTPWFMNLMMIPLDQETFQSSLPQVGDKRLLNIPAGQVELIVGHEEGHGWSLACSLFSPMFEFADQSAALDTAAAALAEALNDAAELEPPEQKMQNIWEGKLPEPALVDEGLEEVPSHPPHDMDRRTFLRGTVPSEPTEIVEKAL